MTDNFQHNVIADHFEQAEKKPLFQRPFRSCNCGYAGGAYQEHDSDCASNYREGVKTQKEYREETAALADSAKVSSAPPPVKLPTDAKARKNSPMARGLLDYFPKALAAVATLSMVANEQHNPGQPMHWAREKSTDHADCIMRHLVDRGHIDTDGMRHSTKVAWRALAMLELELEQAEAN